MSALKSLLDIECGGTNPLVQLSQIYTHVRQDGMNNNDSRAIVTPQTFHLETLLTSLRVSDQTVNTAEDQWTKEFLPSLSNDIPSEPILWNEESYIPSSSPFLFHSNCIFLDQQPLPVDIGFDHDTVQARDNILSFLQERQLAVSSEITSCVEQVIDIDESNQQDDCINPFEEGLKCLQAQDITNAILFFEAAVRKHPEHIDAWFYLGITQTENEQDARAITALTRCVELDPKNLLAYITLATCYTNEMLEKEALKSLYHWLANNEKYSSVLSRYPTSSTIDQHLSFEQLQDFFLQAVLLSNLLTEIDADLQECLGILFHLHHDYNKAAECFHTAVRANPTDARLWNKLGATIANGGQNEKAVDAYYHALTLSPGFIRARYNLGICCLNLQAYKQAVEHCLIALKLQNHGIGRKIHMSEKIWQTLIIAIDRLDRPDLEQCVVYRDLIKLLREFEIE